MMNICTLYIIVQHVHYWIQWKPSISLIVGPSYMKKLYKSIPEMRTSPLMIKTLVVPRVSI